MRIGSLFAGIGGLELGLEQAGLGHTVWQVERDPYCRAVLRRHWPCAARYDDVCAVGADNLERVDLICGGFPCQDVSSAGSRAGLAGSRSGLWREFARVTEALRPEWVVVENVASGAKLWVDAVVRELGEQGYACLPLPVSAADVGAPHRRARIFVVGRLAAHPVVEGVGRPRSGQWKHSPRRRAIAPASPAPDADGRELRHESRRGSGPDWSGAPVAPVDGHAHGEGQPARAVDAEVGGAPRAAPDTPVVDPPQRQGLGRDAREELEAAPGSPWSLPQPGMVRVVHGLRRRLDSPTRRIRALGNSVVPACAEVVGHVILELMKETP